MRGALEFRACGRGETGDADCRVASLLAMTERRQDGETDFRSSGIGHWLGMTGV